ncbi:MAG TPA: hypothetical protein VI911_00530 [Patescibacteria group bacterium]|nr:hypothetical protein [Patescibacteria group bacterium]
MSDETKLKMSKPAMGKHKQSPSFKARINMSKSHIKHGKYAKKELIA